MRALPWDRGSLDAVLLLGPLYHLPDRADRAQALRADDTFTTAFCHSPDQLHDEVASAGFEIDGVHAVEGAGWLLYDKDATAAKATRTTSRAMTRCSTPPCERPARRRPSPHCSRQRPLLAVARAPSRD